MRFHRGGAMVLALLFVVGCGAPKGPTTYPAAGKVIYVGGEAAPGGTVQFQPGDAAAITTFGEVAKDGTFSLHTLVDGEKKPGAVAGPHRVTFIPPIIGTKQDVRPVTLPDLVVVKPGDRNDFILTVPRPR